MLNEGGRQVVGNLITNTAKIPQSILVMVHGTLLGTPTGNNRVQHDVVISLLCGVSRGTVRNWRMKLESHGVRFAALGNQGQTCRQPAQAEVLQTEVSQTAPPQQSQTVWPAIEDMDLPVLPADGGEATDGEADGVGDSVCVSKLEQWRRHPNFLVGMRLAELATQWCVNGWAQHHWPEFLQWAKHRLPANFVGNLNHSKRFVHEFLPSLVAASHTCVASNLHSILPALGVPSLLSRVLDIVSINGQSLLPTLYIHTNVRGEIAWELLGCPCLEKMCESAAAGGAKGAASGAANGAGTSVCGFHKSPQMVQAVHGIEARYQIEREDRALRLVSCVGDQAIQGPGSIRFSEHERLVDNLPPDPLSEGICKFHVSDGVGGATDRAFRETIVYDQLLRLIRRHFAWGTGKLIFRAVAHKFENMAQEFDQKGGEYDAVAANLEAQGKPMAAQRIHNSALRARAEAAALRRAGWTKWRQPMAPKADGTRKVVWQSKSRECFFHVYGLVYWGLQARMVQSLENIRQRHVKEGKVPTALTGMRTKDMRAWRSLGRTILDIRLLVFNLGRNDFRKNI